MNKKNFVYTCINIGLVVVLAVSVFVFEIFTATDPYVLQPISVMAAAEFAKVGYRVDTSKRTLSVFNDKNILVVSDPGVTYRYEVPWLVEIPRKDISDTLFKYKYNLPEYATAEHINPLGSDIPPQIMHVALVNQWQSYFCSRRDAARICSRLSETAARFLRAAVFVCG